MNEGPASSSYPNGVARPTRSSRPPPPIGKVLPARDPMLAVLALDSRGAGWVPGTVAFSAIAQLAFFAAVVFLTQWGLYAWTRRVDAQVHARLNTEYEIDMVKEEPPPPPPEAPKEEPKPEPAPPPAVKPAVAPPPAAPPLAEAAHVLTKEADPNKVEDMTDTVVDGNGNGGGGLSSAQGKGQGFGTGLNPNLGGSPTGTALTPPPPPPAPPTPDRSRAANCVLQTNWNCPWPPEADAAQIDDQYVTVTVSVKPDGSPANVSVMNDPGYGFGRYARSCAMTKRCMPALDHDGNPIGATTRPFRIHFSR